MTNVYDELRKAAKLVLDPRSCLDRQLDGVTSIRKADVSNPLIGEAIRVPRLTDRLVFFLQAETCPSLQAEAAWTLSAMTTAEPRSMSVGYNIQVALSHFTREKQNAVPPLIRLLASPSDAVKQHAAFALGNLASTSERQNLMMSCGALQPLCECIASSVPRALNVFHCAVWALRRLCSEKPCQLTMLQPNVPLFVSLLTHPDDSVVANALWVLCLVAEGDADQRHAILAIPSVMPRLVEVLSSASSSADVITPAIRIMGSIATGDDEQTQVLIDSDVLAHFPLLLGHADATIRKEACWTCSNIAAGSEAQIGALIDAQLIPHIIRNMKDNRCEVSNHAVWTIANIAKGGLSGHVHRLVEATAIESLFDVVCSQSRLQITALDALENILTVGQEEREARNLPHNAYAVAAWSKLQTMEEHASYHDFIRAKAHLKEFFVDFEGGGSGDDGGTA